MENHTTIHEKLTETVLSRFETRVFPEPNTGCYLWGGHVGPTGYGVFWLSGTMVRAHRVALTRKLGREISGDALHSCDNPSCVNPDHLREGTHLENMRDMVNRGRLGQRPTGYKLPRATGSLRHSAKLTESDAVAIRSLAGSVSHAEMGRRYGVTKQAIAGIVRRRTWKHV